MHCSAKTRSGEPCKGQAITGATVCRMHGGEAPQVRRAATRNASIAQAQRMVEAAGVDMDPIQHLLDSLHRAAALVNVWGVMVATLDDHGTEWAERTGELRGSLHYTEPPPKTSSVLSVTSNEPLLGFSQSGEARIHPFVIQYEKALERRAKFAQLCVDAGVAERLIAVAERMGAQLALIFERTVGAIKDLSEGQRLQAAQAYAREIALLERPAIDGTARDAA